MYVCMYYVIINLEFMYKYICMYVTCALYLYVYTYMYIYTVHKILYVLRK